VDSVSDERLRAVDANEIAALSDWVAALDADVAAEYGAQVKRFGHAAALAMPGTETLFFNRVIGLGTLQQATRTLVHDVADFYRNLGSSFMVHVSQDSHPGQLTEWLSQEGLRRQGDEWITLSRGTQPVPPPPSSDLRLERVGRIHARSFAETFCSGYGMPGEWAILYERLVGRDRWRHYLAYDDDAPVATCSLFFNGRNAWCGNSATLRDYRRKGLHTALSRLRLRDGIVAGCDLFTGETWKPPPGSINQSLRNHTGDGWHQVYTRINYALRTD
jgi:hypothetical protein